MMNFFVIYHRFKRLSHAAKCFVVISFHWFPYWQISIYAFFMKFKYSSLPISSCFNKSEDKLLDNIALVNTLNTSPEWLKLISSL